jgi:23S rRNA pseudouridine2605 synthase
MSRSDYSGEGKSSGRGGGNYRKKSYARGNAPIKKKRENVPTSDPDLIRLNKYVANAGVCSRREADTYIAAGNVTVNGKPVTEMGFKVKKTDEVRFDGRLLNPEKKEYILLNKPKNFITTTRDEKGRRTVMELISNATKSRLVPVGRLDRNTTGLLLFTNDGDLAKKLTHPRHGVRKIYHVELNKNLKTEDLHKIQEGIMLEDGLIKVDEVSYLVNAPKKEVGIEIHSGRNRIVRRIFEHLGYDVVKLDRVVFANLTKKDLPRGHWRNLTEQEVINLGMIQ